MGLAYSPANFKAIGQVCSRDMGIICTADKPWNTITDFIQDAKANPGKYLVSCPQGGLQNILFQRLADMTGAQFRVYPVNNDTENLTAVLGGVSDLGVPGSYDVAAGQIAAGQVKVLALFSDTRAASLPNVPTLKELGFDLSFAPWTSLLVPASTPDSLVEKMRGVWREVIQSPELAALLAKNKQKPDYLDGAETQLTIEKQFKDFGETIKSMGLAAK
jgi:tripartite-type tricarboxylate transporter receptor subunit TctC